MLVRWFVRVCAFVPRTPPKLHRFRERRHLCRPWFAPPSTSACAQSRFEFVEIGRGMCSNYPRRHWDYKHVRGWYHRVSRTIYETTVYMYEYMYGMYRYQRCTCRIRMNILMRTYPLWRTYGVPGRIYEYQGYVYKYIFCFCCCSCLHIKIVLSTQHQHSPSVLPDSSS